MATHKPIGHQSKQHHGQADKYGMAEQEFETQQKTGVAEQKHPVKTATKVGGSPNAGKGGKTPNVNG